MGTALYLGEGGELYLADALARDVEAFADLFEGLGLTTGETEAVLEDHALALGKAAQGLLHAALKERGLGKIVRGLGVLVGDEVAEFGGVILADGGLE